MVIDVAENKDVEVEGIAPSSKGLFNKGAPCSVRNQFNPPGLCERDPRERSAKVFSPNTATVPGKQPALSSSELSRHRPRDVR